MNHITKAIQLAIDNGWTEHRGLVNNADYYTNTVVKYQLFLDPLFWSSLGKAMGWEATVEIEYANPLPTETDDDLWLRVIGVPESVYHWHRFIDHLAEGKDAGDFFKDLLNERNH